MCYQCSLKSSVAYLENFESYDKLNFKIQSNFVSRYALFLQAWSQIQQSFLTIGRQNMQAAGRTTWNISLTAMDNEKSLAGHSN